MKEATKWTKDEFKAYVLLYAAMANYIESPEEKEFILTKLMKKLTKRFTNKLT